MQQSTWIEILTNPNAFPDSRLKAIASMRAALRGVDTRLRDEALKTINRIGMSAAELREDLVGLWNDREARIQGFSFSYRIIGALGRVREVATLIDVLQQGEDVALRRSAAYALRPLGRAAEAAACPLVDSLRDKDKRYRAMTRRCACRSIGMQSSTSPREY